MKHILPFKKALYYLLISKADCWVTFRYTIETNTVTTTFARTVWPSTTTVVSFVECAPRPSFSRMPPMGPSVVLSTAGVQSKRQVAVVSTTVHQTRLVYAASMYYH